MGVSQRLSMCITCPINIAFNIMNIKIITCYKSTIKACKHKELEITKSWWSFHQTSLESDAFINMIFELRSHPALRYHYSHVV